MEVELDFERLRNDLMDYYGTAMCSGFGMAVVDLVKIQNASYEKLIQYAQECNIDIEKYIIKVLKC